MLSNWRATCRTGFVVHFACGGVAASNRLTSTPHVKSDQAFASALALPLHPLPAGDLAFAGRIDQNVGSLDLTPPLVVADNQSVRCDAGLGQLEGMRRR